MIPDQYSVEDIQKLIFSICEDEFGPSDNRNCFRVKDTTVNAVKDIIFNRMQDYNLKKMKYLDMAVYVLQTNNDVFIDIV